MELLPAVSFPALGLEALWAPVLLCGHRSPRSWPEDEPSPCSWFWVQLNRPRDQPGYHSHLWFQA